jgi:Holliday junction resolvasome RuvABC endonuclease subunit
MRDTYVYALDLSLNSTGIGVFTNDGQLIRLVTIDTKSEKEDKLKLSLIGKVFLMLIKNYTPSVVIIEQGFSLFNRSTQAIFKVHGLANYIFSEYEQIYYPATTIKKEITGKGNASKEEVRKEILKKYPEINFASFDESDAYAIAETFFIRQGIKNAKINVS